MDLRGLSRASKRRKKLQRRLTDVKIQPESDEEVGEQPESTEAQVSVCGQCICV
jgi:hypothetical protein